MLCFIVIVVIIWLSKRLRAIHRHL